MNNSSLVVLWLLPMDRAAPIMKFSNFQMKKNLGESSQPSATKYMKRFLSPTSQERQPLTGKEVMTDPDQ